MEDNQSQLINQIEKKVTETQSLITNHEEQLTKWKGVLLTLIEELRNIKENKPIK